MLSRKSLCRLSLIFLPISIFLTYLFINARPPYAFYNGLKAQEFRDSRETVGLQLKGGKPRFVAFKQLRGAGFNNQVQDILLFHNLALATSRTYAYHPFVWRPRGETSYVPLSAFLPGVTKDSITMNVFYKVCRVDEIQHVTLGTPVHEEQWQHALDVLNGDQPCVLVHDWIFNWNFLASPGIRPIWPTFHAYLQNHFEWSDSILNITHRAQTELNLRATSSSTTGEDYIALHLRRGDFESHCESLSKENSTGFTTWATLPQLQGSVLHPPLDTSNSTSILMHCYPSLRRVLSAVKVQAEIHPEVHTLYVLHDGAIDHPLVYLQFYKLRTTLMNEIWARRNHWPGGPMTRVLQSSDAQSVKIRGESDFGVGLDVELARRAVGFVGNGYSSLSTQIVALRLADSGRAEDITFV